jgi:hypothetical protein
MARLIESIVAFGPKLIYGRTANLDDIALLLSKRSGLSALDAEMALRELSGAIIHQLRGGQPVKLPGIGRLRATVGRGGRMRVHVVADVALVKALNAPGTYRGEMANRARIGLDDAGYKALWDGVHPEDPLEVAVEATPATR